MTSHHSEPAAASTSVVLRAAGIVLGVVLLIALIALSRISLEYDREAVLSQATMQWTLLVVIAAFVLCAAVAVVLVAGRWPPDREILKALTGSVSVAIVWMFAAVIGSFGIDLKILGCAVAIVHVLIGAVLTSGWKYLTVPVSTTGIAAITTLWALLARNTASNELLGQMSWEINNTFTAIAIVTILPMLALVLTGIGGWLGWKLLDRQA